MTGRTNPVPGLSLPAPYDNARTRENFQTTLLWSKGISPRMLFVDGPLLGSNPPPPPSDAYLYGGGTQTVVFTAGEGVVTYPVAFPNGIMWIIPWHASSGTDVFSIDNSGHPPTLGGFHIISSAGGSGSETIGYTVLGW